MIPEPRLIDSTSGAERPTDSRLGGGKILDQIPVKTFENRAKFRGVKSDKIAKRILARNGPFHRDDFFELPYTQWPFLQGWFSDKQEGR